MPSLPFGSSGTSSNHFPLLNVSLFDVRDKLRPLLHVFPWPASKLDLVGQLLVAVEILGAHVNFKQVSLRISILLNFLISLFAI